jgi:hypothetical protein
LKIKVTAYSLGNFLLSSLLLLLAALKLYCCQKIATERGALALNQDFSFEPENNNLTVT